MAAEQEGADAYKLLVSKTRFQDEKDFFHFMAGQEELHYQQLGELKKSLISAGNYLALSKSPASEMVPKIFAKKREEWNKRVRPPSQEELQSILDAMDLEKAFRDFYKGIAGRLEKTAGDPVGIAFFDGLAEWEQAHYDYLDQLFEGITYPQQYTLG